MVKRTFWVFTVTIVTLLAAVVAMYTLVSPNNSGNESLQLGVLLVEPAFAQDLTFSQTGDGGSVNYMGNAAAGDVLSTFPSGPSSRPTEEQLRVAGSG